MELIAVVMYKIDVNITEVHYEPINGVPEYTQILHHEPFELTNL